MTITTIWTGKTSSVRVNDSSYSLNDYFSGAKHMALYTEAICCNTIGSIEEASATEMAMLKMADKCGINYKQVRKDHLPEGFLRF
jgi:hypothetical protein